MPRTIYLLRHGTIGSDGRFVGSTDLDLSDEGRQQVQRVQALLAVADIDKVFCSPMRRCRQSMELLTRIPEGEVLSDLREIDFGQWEQLSYEDIASGFPEHLRLWEENPESFAFPEGESLKGFNDRLLKVSSRLEGDECENMLLICHGGVIRHLICLFLRLPCSSSMLFTVKPGCVTRIDMYDQGGVLSGLNLTGGSSGYT